MEELKTYEINETELAKCAYAVLSTERGDINIKLYPKSAPQTVANFAELAKSGFYDGLDLLNRNLFAFQIHHGDVIVKDGDGIHQLLMVLVGQIHQKVLPLVYISHV